ncbi:UPF0489 protein C5orf22-like [Ylistrum balloti]|uniref:UPF0489 protein C5orf22-like n=1 Tax=Ylistrum balloti TaxID=509963 RepID=UPI002905F72C|nr:UPF0489 protein C5orf22-like [Ylistrum balloti]
MAKLRKYGTIPLYVVEDHNEVVPFIHRAIGGRYLPMSDIIFVHFDSHPDLLIPAELKADDIFNKDILYESQSIENWILPMVYAGHISNVIWFKPPWCEQIRDKTIQFDVGKCSSTGYLRTSCKESYFVSETLYRPAENLLNRKSLTLTVITVQPTNWSEKQSINTCQQNGVGNGQKERNMCHSDEKTKSEVKEDLHKNTDVLSQGESCKLDTGSKRVYDTDTLHSDVCHESICPKKKQRLSPSENSDSSPCNLSQESLSHELILKLENLFENFKDRHIVLDIDLDFFSTKNPFQELYSPRQFQLLQDLYVYSKPTDDSDEAITKCVEEREAQLSELKQILQSMGDNPGVIPKHDRSELILTLVEDLRQHFGEDGVDFGLLHDAGCTCDDTELPHHVSSQEQITLLVDSVQELLCHMHKPTIITMARSSNDDYCPPDQVDYIQDQTLEILQDLYLKLNLTASY